MIHNWMHKKSIVLDSLLLFFSNEKSKLNFKRQYELEKSKSINCIL